MPSEPAWLEPAEIIELNREIVAAAGEPHFLRDEGLLLSALGSPVNHWLYEGEEDAVSLAVTLLFSLARNHAFEQGNKRTAFEAALIFLANNGYGFNGPDDPQLAHALTAVIAHERSEQDFEAMIRPFVAPAATSGMPAW